MVRIVRNASAWGKRSSQASRCSWKPGQLSCWDQENTRHIARRSARGCARVATHVTLRWCTCAKSEETSGHNMFVVKKLLPMQVPLRFWFSCAFMWALRQIVALHGFTILQCFTKWYIVDKDITYHQIGISTKFVGSGQQLHSLCQIHHPNNC